MPKTMPVSVEYRLPPGWHAVPPDQTGAPGVAFMALRSQQDDGFAANITMDGELRSDAATLAEIADVSVQRMGELVGSVVVTDRREVGSAAVPGLTQNLAFSVIVNAVRHELVQSQVYLSLPDATDPRKCAVVKMALTATTAQHNALLGDFQEFVRMVRPKPKEQADGLFQQTAGYEVPQQ
ncbi:hypothetical protein [Streptomyces sp. NPDC002671]